ncbi:MAG: hypothetical protein KAH04_01995 [Psychrilyobacter sp.]|nr:hypothetical protein [Psychrilyobacter sp.]
MNIKKTLDLIKEKIKTKIKEKVETETEIEIGTKEKGENRKKIASKIEELKSKILKKKVGNSSGNKMNFITEKHKEKLMIEEYIRTIIIISTGISLVFVLIFIQIKSMESSVQAEIDTVNVQKTEIEKKVKQQNDQIKGLISQVEERTQNNVEIMTIEKLFDHKATKISKVFLTLGQSVPTTAWIESIIYDDGEVRVKGYAFNDGDKVSPESISYMFEEKMLESNVYKDIILIYLKKSSKYGEKTYDFEYNLILK